MGSELVDPSIDRCVEKKCMTTEPFFKLQLSCMDRLMAKVCLNYKCLFFNNPWHLERQIWYTFRTITLFSISKKIGLFLELFKLR